MAALSLVPLLLVIFSLPAQAAPPKELASQVIEAVEDWDLPLARTRLATLIAEAPDSQERKAAEARVALDDANYDRASRLYDELGADHPYAEVARAAREITAGYERRDSEHFSFYYPPGKDALLAPYALDALERQYAALSQALGYAPKEKVRVEVLDDARALSRVTTLSLDAIKTSGTIAICKFNRLMFTSPKALVRGYTWLDTLAHEYVHLVVSQASRNSVPIWIHEGIAKYYETAWRGAPGEGLSPSAAALLNAAATKGKLVSFERMHPSIALLPSQQEAALAYAEVFTVMERLASLPGGSGAMAQLIVALRDGAEPKEAMARAARMPFAQFERGWKEWLIKRPVPKEAVSLDPEKLRFAEDEPKPSKKSKDQDVIRFGDFLEIEDSQGRQLAHLGELLRTRDRPDAAAQEFAKAHTRVGSRSPVLSNRYAQALIQLKRFPDAERVLTASEQLYPNFPKTLLNLGEVYVSTDKLADAERAFVGVIGVDPFDPAPHAALAALYERRGDDAKAKREKSALKILAGAKLGLASGMGGIQITTSPYARVRLNGIDTGRTTPTRLQAPPGTHVLVLTNDERGITKEIGVEVEAGEVTEIEVNLGDEGKADSGSAQGGRVLP